MKIKSLLLLFLFSFISLNLLAQDENGGMASLMRSNGRIYVGGCGFADFSRTNFISRKVG
jgi:hypothetical protein